MRFDYDQLIKIAADSLAKLRKVDVYRVLDCAPKGSRKGLARHIVEGRPDLADEVADSLTDLDQ